MKVYNKDIKRVMIKNGRPGRQNDESGPSGMEFADMDIRGSMSAVGVSRTEKKRTTRCYWRI